MELQASEGFHRPISSVHGPKQLQPYCLTNNLWDIEQNDEHGFYFLVFHMKRNAPM